MLTLDQSDLPKSGMLWMVSRILLTGDRVGFSDANICVHARDYREGVGHLWSYPIAKLFTILVEGGTVLAERQLAGGRRSLPVHYYQSSVSLLDTAFFEAARFFLQVH